MMIGLEVKENVEKGMHNKFGSWNNNYQRTALKSMRENYTSSPLPTDYD